MTRAKTKEIRLTLGVGDTFTIGDSVTVTAKPKSRQRGKGGGRKTVVILVVPDSTSVTRIDKHGRISQDNQRVS